MLGWEFPPVINGGLGVACHDLCIALAKTRPGNHDHTQNHIPILQ